jgi:protein disulfide-isomerase
MKSFITASVALLLICLGANSYLFEKTFYQDDEESDGIFWHEDFSEAVCVSKSNNKTLVMLFVDTNNCHFSNKIIDEVVNDEAFIENIKNEMVFFKADFATNITTSTYKVEQNEKLKRKHHVTGYPTIVLLDSKQKHISTLGYLPMVGKKYADNIKNIVAEYFLISDTLLYFEDDEDICVLENSHERAKKIGSMHFQKQILNKGLKKDKGTYFLIEKYKILLDQGKDGTIEAIELREKILEKDHHNISKLHLQLAILDFQYLAKKTNITDIKKIITPLIEYINAYKKNDRENIWRIQMMITQFLFTKGDFRLALKYARDAYKSAPIIIRKDLARTIKYLKQKK